MDNKSTYCLIYSTDKKKEVKHGWHSLEEVKQKHNEIKNDNKVRNIKLIVKETKQIDLNILK
ncbi:hypothetical protein D3C87_75660 [compost metagenome]